MRNDTELLIRRINSATDTEFATLKSFLFAELSKITKSPEKYDWLKIRRRIWSMDLKPKVQAAYKKFFRDIDNYNSYFQELGYDEANVRALTEIPSIKAYANAALIELGGRSNLMTSDIKKSFDKSVYGKQPINDLVQIIGGKWSPQDEQYKGGLLAKYKHQAFTVANTGLAIVDRKIQLSMAIDLGIEWYRYDGPARSEVTRPFCYALIHGKNPNSNGKIPYSQDSKNFNKWFAGLSKMTNPNGYLHITEILKLDNGQIKNVIESGGGYNCQHSWREAQLSMNRNLIEMYPELHEEFLSQYGIQ